MKTLITLLRLVIAFIVALPVSWLVMVEAATRYYAFRGQYGDTDGMTTMVFFTGGAILFLLLFHGINRLVVKLTLA